MSTSDPPAAPAPDPRRALNDQIGVRAFERGEALARHRPLDLHLQLASGCNLDCYMCTEHLRPEAARHGRGAQFLGDELLERVARELWPYTRSTEFGVGGEPMLHPRFTEIVERAHAAGQEVHVTTNGTLLTSEGRAAALARCARSIEVSVDGATRATYERIRAGASFEALLANLERLRRARLALPEPDRGALTLCMVLMASNVHELPAYVELAARLGADGVAAWPVIGITPEGRADDLAQAVEGAAGFMDEARERARALGLALDLPALRTHSVEGARPSHQPSRTVALERLHGQGRDGTAAAQPVPCHMPTLALYAMHDGRLFPCGNPHVHAAEPIGDLRRQGFEEIWNGRDYRNLRAGLARGDAPPACRSCPIVFAERALDSLAATNGEAPASLAQHYGTRDLVPVDWPRASGAFIEECLESGLAERFGELSSERTQLLARVAELCSEREHLCGHIENLDSERAHMRGHITNLERILHKVRGRQVYRALSAVKDTFLRGRQGPPG